jgi:hypothetical protein
VKDANTTLQLKIVSLEPKLLDKLNATNTCREMLYQQAEEDEGLALMRAKSKDMLENLKVLYNEIIELITKIRDL